MKKVLFGTTAIAAAMTAGVATAESHMGPKVKVNLVAIETFAIQDAAIANVHDTYIEDYYEFKVDAEQQLEAFGGIEIGAEVEVRSTVPTVTGSTTFDADEQHSYVKGAFGQVYFGQTDSAAEKMYFQVTGGTADETLGIGGVSGFAAAPSTNALGFSSTNVDNVDSDSTKIGYLSPKFGDMVSFGVSWSPMVSKSSWLSAADDASNDVGGKEDAVSAGIGLGTSFGDVKLKAAAAFHTTGFEVAPTATTVEEEWAISAQLSVAGFTFGGSYNNEEFAGAAVGAGDEADKWTIGVDYAINGGQYTVGATYGGGKSDVGLASGTAEDEADFWQVGGSMALAPNVILSAAYLYGDFDGAAVTDRGEASAFSVQTLFIF